MKVRFFFGVALAFLAARAWAAHELVRDGVPQATVVLDAGASDQLKGAVDCLVKSVEAASGARLPVASAPPPAGTVVYVGRSPAVAAFRLDQAGLDDDGFDIAFPDARSVVILGPTDWGTEFGVYEMLERYVGVRWLLPGVDGADIPVQKTLVLDGKPVRQQPAFISRLFSGLRGPVQGDWARRNRMHGRIEFHHNLIRLFPPETYTQPHPEFFPIRNGKRFLPATNATHGWQPCLTAPGLTEEAVANITRYFGEHPDAPSYSLGANDSGGYCQCPNCLARLSGAKNFLGLVDYSDLYYDWANQVIEGVAKTYPDKLFGCLAYSEVAAPPGKVQVSAKLIPYLTYDRMKWVDPDLRREGEELTRAWHAKSPVLGWYDYIYGTPYVLPRVWFHHMADYYRFGRANGVRALYAEAYPNWGEGPKLYVSLKLQWDPSRNVDALLDEWFARCVGPDAAPFLAKYYAHWEEFWTRRVLASKWFSKGGQYLSFSNPGYLADISLDEIRESRGWLETAIAKTGTDRQRARARLLLAAFEYYEATAYACKAGEIGPDDTVATEAQALKVLDAVATSMDYVEKRRHLALEVFPKDPVLVHPIPINESATLAGSGWGSGLLWRVYDQAAKSDGKVRQRLRDLAAANPSPMIKGQAAMMVSLIDGRFQSLTQNPSFEEGTAAAAANWSWWVKFPPGTMKRTDETAHTGKFSVLCTGMKRGGPVQTVAVTAGKYALVCFVRTPKGQASKGTVELAMTLRDAQDRNVTSPSTKCLPPATGEWVALALAADVPAKVGDKDVKSMMPIVILDGFEPDAKVFFDDLMLYRLAE